SEEVILRRAALGAVISVPGNATTKAFAQELPALPPDGKVVLLGALAARGDALGLTETVNKLATDENPAIREAAIKALARLGNASSVAALAAALTQKELASSVSQTLVALQGEGVAEALIKQAETGEVAVRQGVLNVLAERRQTDALPAVRQAANSEDAGLRRAALKTLAALGTQEDLATLAVMLLAKKDQSERDQMAQAMSDISGRITDKAAGCEIVLQAMSKADASAKVCLLTVLSTLGGDKALQAVRASLAGEGELRKAAIRALADWPDAAPVPDLLSVAKEDKEKSNQILALRGYIKMLGQTGGRAEKKLASYREAMALAARPDEKRLVLAGLADVAHADALKMVEAFLEDAALGREAFISYEKIAESLAGRQPALAREALNRVVEKAGDGGLRNKAKKALDKIK
ncbi:MAG: HEAT repeat domain-containing protein, partial [Verrucomicrobia bacterium]|nr:HEAT repeat domain-containing protein [Verrucomicrobiota bacterium]